MLNIRKYSRFLVFFSRQPHSLTRQLHYSLMGEGFRSRRRKINTGSRESEARSGVECEMILRVEVGSDRRETVRNRESQRRDAEQFPVWSRECSEREYRSSDSTLSLSHTLSPNRFGNCVKNLRLSISSDYYRYVVSIWCLMILTRKLRIQVSISDNVTR